ncbi:MAG: acetamidase/formamidase family protein [Pseudomonadota bacterium]
MPTHDLAASPDSVHWGYFDASLPLVLEVESGDKVTLTSVSGGPEVVPKSGFFVPDALRDIHASVRQKLQGHILTGPVAVRGAEPGHVLEVRIHDIRLVQDWGYNAIRPLAGALPHDFHETRLMTIPLDADRGVATLPWGTELHLQPFFGVMGVAPPLAWGAITSIIPRQHGGNLDNKELGAGATLYLPIHVEGALFSAGNGHGVQGDGEVCVTAIETALKGTFELILRSDLSLSMPRAETPTHFITMGLNPDLDDAATEAVRDMIALICERTNLSEEDAYTLCSLAADLRVTQIVNHHKGVHMMLEKSLVRGS